LKRRETLQGFFESNDQQIVNEAESPLIYSPTPEETKALMRGALVQQDVQDCLAKKDHGSIQR
jgi:hypothetical protein